MRYHNITTDDMLNGLGLRVVLWVSGCNHYCEGCHNQITWDCNSGLEFDLEAERELFKYLCQSHIRGLTLSGGDPLYPANREKILELVKKVKKILPKKDIWLYTGFKYEDIESLEILNYVDYLVDGKFEIDKKDTSLEFKGSSNQNIYRLKNGKIVGKYE